MFNNKERRKYIWKYKGETSRSVNIASYVQGPELSPNADINSVLLDKVIQNSWKFKELNWFCIQKSIQKWI